MPTLTDTLPSLTLDEIHRYSRHLLLDEIGVDGQRRLKAARVLCVGVGGLGSPATLYLAAAGVGTIGLVDFDAVDSSNLQRQILYGAADVGTPKLVAAARRLADVNPSIAIDTHAVALTSVNALDLLARYDLVIDGTDNFATRYLVNDACVLLGKPNVYGSIFRFEGQASIFAAGPRAAANGYGSGDGPCYRCLYPEPPPPGLIPSCGEAGVLGVLPGVIGTIQATEAIKLITGVGEPLIGRFLIYDALRMRFRELKLPRDPDCPACGAQPTIRSLADSADTSDTSDTSDYEQSCGPLRGAGVSLSGAGVPAGHTAIGDRSFHSSEKESGRMTAGDDVTATELKSLLDRSEVTLIDVREPSEQRICQISGSTLIPLGDLTRRVAELDPSSPLVIHCKSGGRSARAVAWLRGQGFSNVRNMQGGILAWITEVDPSLTKY